LSILERYRFRVSDGAAFTHVDEDAFPDSSAAEAHAIQLAKELSRDGAWYGGWVSVSDSGGDEIARLPIPWAEN
jgi:hypothetical protein